MHVPKKHRYQEERGNFSLNFGLRVLVHIWVGSGETKGKGGYFNVIACSAH